MNEVQVNSIIVASYNIKNYGDITALIEKLESQPYSNIRIFLVIEGPAYLFAEIRNHIEKSNLRRINVIFNNNEGRSTTGLLKDSEHRQREIAIVSEGKTVICPDWLN